MNARLEKVYNRSWSWNNFQLTDPKPSDVEFVMTEIPRASNNHNIFATKINKELGGVFIRGVTYPTLIRLVSVAINNIQTPNNTNNNINNPDSIKSKVQY